MAESIVVEYGGKRTPVTPGLAEKDVKALMARYFPELADPKIDKKKDGDVEVWTFSKKAGTKGAAHATVLARLQALPETPLAPAWVVAAALGQPHAAGDAAKALRALDAEGTAAATLRSQLADVRPHWTAAAAHALGGPLL